MLPLRPAAVLARSVASLDLLSGGRGRAGPAFVLGPSGDIVSAIGTFAEQGPPLYRERVAAERAGRSGGPESAGAADRVDLVRSEGCRRVLARRWSESESESAADAARPLERDGSWGNAGGLPVTDRPRARPSSAADQPGGVGIPAGRDNHRNLVAIHDHLRSELEQIRLAVSQVADGELDPGGARTLIARMTLRQNHWTLGSFCASYCRIVTIHHTVEDAHLFPNLDGGTLAGAGVATAGRRTHQVIAEVLDRFDRTLVDLVYEEQGRALPARSGTAEIGELADELSALLLSHLAYEEDELVAGLARMPGPI